MFLTFEFIDLELNSNFKFLIRKLELILRYWSYFSNEFEIKFEKNALI